MNPPSIRIQSKIKDLEYISETARMDYENLPDDGSIFPNCTPMKNLKLSFLTLHQVSNGLANKLKDIQATGKII